MNLFELSAKISVDDSDFKKSMENAQKVSKNVAKAMQELQSPLDKVKSGFNAIAHPIETAKKGFETLKNKTEEIRHPIETFKAKVQESSTALEAQRNKLSVLASGYDSAKKKVDELTKEFNKSAKESGTSSKKTQELAEKLKDAENKASSAKKEMDDFAESVSKAGKNSGSAKDKIAGLVGGLGKVAHGVGTAVATSVATAAKVGVAAVGAASTAIVALGKIGLDYNSQMEQYTTNFTTMLGSQQDAVKKVDELKKFAASTPLSMDDLAKGTQTLLAFGVESENSTGILRQLGDIALGDADKMQRLSTAFGKATASGKLSGEVVQQMIDAGWNPLIQISKAAGETMEETQKRMSAGAISVEELQSAMEAVTTGTGQFAGGMEAASHTTQGLISTLKDNAAALVGEVFQPISDGLLGEVLPGAIEAIGRLTTAFQTNGVSGMVTAASDIVASFLTAFTGRLPEFITLAMNMLQTLGSGISQNLPTITNAAFQTFMAFVQGLTQMLPGLLDMALQMVMTLGQNLVANAPQIVDSAVQLFTSFIDTLIEWLPELVPLAFQIVTKLATSLIDNIPTIAEKVVELGAAVVDAIIQGISDAWDGLVSWFNGLWDNLFGNRTVNVNVNETSSSGVDGSHAGGLSYVPFDGYIAELHKGERVLTAREAKAYKNGEKSSGGGVTVIQNIYSQAKTAAELMREAQYEQRRALMMGAI